MKQYTNDNSTVMRRWAQFLLGTAILSTNHVEARVWSHPPSMFASDMPSLEPSPAPSIEPTPAPSTSIEPSSFPSASPSDEPTVLPTIWPTLMPSASPSNEPTTVPSASPSHGPTTTPSVSPTSSPTTSPSNFPSDVPSLVPTDRPSANPSGSPSAAPTIAPSATPSVTPTVAPSSEPSKWPSDFPSMVPSSKPSGTPSVTPTTRPSAAPSGFPSDFPSLVPTDQPSSTPSSSPTGIPTAQPSPLPSAFPTISPSVSPSSSPTALPTASPSSKPSGAPSSSPTASPSSSPSHRPTTTPTAMPSASPSHRPSSPPTMAPSVIPSASPTFSPTSIPTSSPTPFPSPMPSARPSSLPTTTPSATPTNAPTSVPTSVPSSLGEVSTVESVTLASTQNTIMDAETTAVFERVCQFDFLPYYLPRMFPADYSDISCKVISQTLLGNDDNDGSRRRDLQDTSVVQLSTGNTAILFRVRSKMQVQEGITLNEDTTFDVILESTFEKYGSSFQEFLSQETAYFESTETEERGEDPAAAGDGIITAGESTTSNLPTVIILGSALGGAVMAIGFATYFLRRSLNEKGPASPPQDITDDSVLLLFEPRDKKKPENEEHSINPYLPPTPLGIGVPSEIGPDSWIEPDDELSAASPDNQGVEASEYISHNGPFGFNRSASDILQDIQKSRSNPGTMPSSDQPLVPKSRAAQILASLASESFSRMSSDPSNSGPVPVPISRNFPLETVESRESEDDDTKPTVSSKGSQPTKGSHNTGHTNGSQSDGSSTLHGLKLVGTASGYQSNEGSMSAQQPSDYDSDPSYEKRAFFRKVMKRKSAPSPPTTKGPPITKRPSTKGNMKCEFSNHPSRRRLVLPTSGKSDAAKNECRDDNSSQPTSATAPTRIITNKTAAIFDDVSSIPTSGTTDSLLLSQTGSSTASQQRVNKVPSLPIDKTSSSSKGLSKGSSVRSNLSSKRSGSPHSKYNMKPVPPSRRPQLRNHSSGRISSGLKEAPTADTGPTPYSPSVESISVDPRRAAGTPTDTGTMRRYEDCTIRSPVESFVRKNETPKGTRFLQMSTDSAQHTGDVLEDLGRLEDEWDGQLESKLSATATTPRHTNSEKFRKAPRQHIYQEENMV